MGAYGGWNNLDNQGRDLRIFGTTGTMAWFDESASSVGIGNIYSNTVLPPTVLSAGVTDAANNTVLRPFTVERITSGTPATGIGVGMQFTTETTAGNKIGSAIESVATDVSGGAEDFDLIFSLMEGGATAAQKMKISSSGALTASSSIVATTTVTAGTIVTATTGLITGATATLTYNGIQSGSVTIDGALGSHFSCAGASTPTLQAPPVVGSQIVIFREAAPGGDVVIDCALSPVSGIFTLITLQDMTPASVTLYATAAGWVVVADSGGVVYT